MLPIRVGAETGARYFERVFLATHRAGFYVNVRRVRQLGNPHITGQPVCAGICSTDAIMGNPDLVVSSVITGKDLEGGVSWSEVANNIAIMGRLIMDGRQPWRVAH